MTPQGAALRCHRCLQPTPPNVRRCPNCREIVRTGDARRISLYVAVVGLIGVLALVGVGLYLTPSTVDPENHPELERQAPPPKPAKKPPLN